MSDTLIHFATSAVVGTASDLAAQRILGKKIHPSLSLIKHAVFFGLVSASVDLDHTFYLLKIDFALKYFEKYSLNPNRPFHLHIPILSLVFFVFSLIAFKNQKTKYFSRILVLSSGIAGAVVTHYFFDYFLACYFHDSGFNCFIANPEDGAKIIKIFK